MTLQYGAQAHGNPQQEHRVDDCCSPEPRLQTAEQILVDGIPDQCYGCGRSTDHGEPPQDVEQLLGWSQVHGQDGQQTGQSG